MVDAGSAEGTKAGLLRVTRDLLVEGGLQTLSMRKVSRACGISATAIYRHFEHKDALVAAAVAQGFMAFEQYLLSALSEPVPLARLRALALAYFAFAREHPADYRLMFMTDCRDLGLLHLGALAKQQASGTFEILRTAIGDCQEEGEVGPGDARTIAASVWASVHGLASLLLTGNLGASEDEQEILVALHINQMLRGLRT